MRTVTYDLGVIPEKLVSKNPNLKLRTDGIPDLSVWSDKPAWYIRMVFGDEFGPDMLAYPCGEPIVSTTLYKDENASLVLEAFRGHLHTEYTPKNEPRWDLMLSFKPIVLRAFRKAEIYLKDLTLAFVVETNREMMPTTDQGFEFQSQDKNTRAFAETFIEALVEENGGKHRQLGQMIETMVTVLQQNESFDEEDIRRIISTVGRLEPKLRMQIASTDGTIETLI